MTDTLRIEAAFAKLPFNSLAPLDSPILVPASVELRGDYLAYTLIQIHAMPGYANPSEALDRFLRLKRPEDMLRFARRFGPLNLCEHGIPRGHRNTALMPTVLTFAAAASETCRPFVQDDDGWFLEPWSAWKRWVEVARGVIEIGANVYNGRQTPPARWDSLDLADKLVRKYEDTEWVKMVVGEAIDHWLILGGLRPSFWWHGKPRLFFFCEGVFGHIGLQLAGAASRAPDRVICSGCSEVYHPRRRPHLGTPSYCGNCKVIANKERQRRYRARKGRQNG